MEFRFIQWCLSNRSKMLSNNDIQKRWTHFKCPNPDQKMEDLPLSPPPPHSPLQRVWIHGKGHEMMKETLSRTEPCSVMEVKAPLQSPWALQVVVNSDVRCTAIDYQNIAAELRVPFSQPFWELQQESTEFSRERDWQWGWRYCRQTLPTRVPTRHPSL